MKTLVPFLLSLILSITTVNATTLKVLFIGNSYTGTNNLPRLIENIAKDNGDTLIYKSVEPGGMTFKGHATSTTTLDAIRSDKWDYVVLQEQSQMPAFPETQVIRDVYPYAKQLDSLIKANNPCSKSMFYVTWGRKNGDASNCPGFPPICTYLGMDSMLQARYIKMAEQNKAYISPVAMVWRQFIMNHKEYNLYSGDESHPSMDGSVVAAAVFYTSLFQKNPMETNYHSTPSPHLSELIKRYCYEEVYMKLDEWQKYVPKVDADFDYTYANDTVKFSNLHKDATYTYEWNFGDGNTSTEVEPFHIYEKTDNYNVTLKITKCNIDTATVTKTVYGYGLGIKNYNNPFILYPNPTTNEIIIKHRNMIKNIEVYNTIGQKVINISPNKKDYIIDVSHLNNGIYIIKINNQTASFIKE